MAAAREYRERALTKLKNIRNGKRDDKIYDDVMAAFLEDCTTRLKPGAVTRYKVSARAMHSYFTGKKLAEISKADIVIYLADRKRELTGSGVNRDRALLSSMYTFACDRDWCEYNPAKMLKRAKESEPRTRNLTKDEFKTIRGKCSRLLADMTEFCVETGLRASELVFLEWSNINNHKHEITLTETKAGIARIVPLSTRASQILASQIRHVSAPYVFWHKDGKPYRHAPRAFAETAEAAGLKDVIFHDLRRTFTCWHYSKGVPLQVLSKLLGHSTYAITERHYSFLTKEDLHNAIRGVTKSSQTQGTKTVNLSKLTRGKARKC